MIASKSLLIVEDDPDLRMTLEFFLGRIGYEVLTAKNSEDGLKICMEKLPRAVLCDIALPGMDGYEACAKIKGDPVTQDIAVIFITAKPAAEVLDKGAKACADYFISKPVDPNDVGADLYVLFEKDFQLSENDIRNLRVTKRVPTLSESMHAGYSHDPKTPHIEPPKHSKHTPTYESVGQRSLGVHPPREKTPEARSPSPAPAATGMAKKSKSSMELQQVHELLLALKKSLKDTSQRLDAILQYIDVIDSQE